MRERAVCGKTLFRSSLQWPGPWPEVDRVNPRRQQLVQELLGARAVEPGQPVGRHAHAGLCAKLELDSTFRDGDIAKAALVLGPSACSNWATRSGVIGARPSTNATAWLAARNASLIRARSCSPTARPKATASYSRELAATRAGGVLGQVGLDAALAQRCLQPGQHHRPFPDQQDAIRHGGCASHRCLIGVALEGSGVFTVDPLSRAA